MPRSEALRTVSVLSLPIKSSGRNRPALIRRLKNLAHARTFEFDHEGAELQAPDRHHVAHGYSHGLLPT